MYDISYLNECFKNCYTYCIRVHGYIELDIKVEMAHSTYSSIHTYIHYTIHLNSNCGGASYFQ